MKTIAACRVCQSKNLVGFFDLGKQPLANSLPKSPDKGEERYPLSLAFCRDCFLVQLEETVEPEKLFSEYVWVTATSRTANEYAEKFYEEAVARTGNSENKYVLEVASNDGTFLKPFKRAGWDVEGVDPAKNICEIAEADGVPTRCVFFGEQAARDIVKEHGYAAHIVFARNVLPHVANTVDFTRGLAAAVSDGGTVIVEAHYASVILEELHYDSIYHEHLCYFTLRSLERLLNDAGLFVYDVIRSPISGGSLVVFAKKGKGDVHPRVAELREKEKSAGTNDFARWEEFARRAFAHREKFVGLLRETKNKGAVVAGWGASARSSTLLNFCGIDTKIISAIVDLSPLKQGRFTAGTKIPIKNAEEVMAAKPGCVVILAWNFAGEITEALKDKFQYRGSVIVPLPKEPRELAL